MFVKLKTKTFLSFELRLNRFSVSTEWSDMSEIYGPLQVF